VTETATARVGSLHRYAWPTVGTIAAVTGLAHLAVATRYGWHRDELYYVDAGHHPAFGYVDQPPLTPLVARLADLLPGGVLPLRLVAIAAQVGCILLVAALARELGAARRAQSITAACVAASPLVVAGSMLLGTTILDELAWSATILLVARALRTRTTASWVAAGVVAGIGLENKQTMVVLIAGTLLGLALVRRDALRTPAPWVAGAIAFLIWLPNVVWNAANGWPSLDMARVLARKQGGPGASFAQLPLAVLAATGLLVVVLVVGVRWLATSEHGRPHRWLLVVATFALVAFAATGGKLYYAAPALLPLLAAGGVALGSRPDSHGWLGSRWLAVLVVISWLLATLVLLPFVPARSAVVAEQRETYGWPELAEQVTDVARTLPRDTVVFTSNYGEAGAIQRFGPPLGMHLPVRSGHNSWGDWGPALRGTPRVVLAVGEFDERFLRRFWRDVQRVDRVRFSEDVTNEEIDEHAAIYICRRPVGTWSQLWPGLRHLD
jgi:4-amino-4-deoxy-L-arabinose transferase-like glycosyltransferase